MENKWGIRPSVDCWVKFEFQYAPYFLGFVKGIGYDYAEIRKDYPEEGLFKVYTFNSKRKSMMTVIELQEEGKKTGYRVFCKGASEMVLKKCKFFIGKDGRPEAFSNEKHKEIGKIIENMAENGLRTICIAYKDYVYKTGRPASEIEVLRGRFSTNCLGSN